MLLLVDLFLICLLMVSWLVNLFLFKSNLNPLILCHVYIEFLSRVTYYHATLDRVDLVWQEFSIGLILECYPLSYDCLLMAPISCKYLAYIYFHRSESHHDLYSLLGFDYGNTFLWSIFMDWLCYCWNMHDWIFSFNLVILM